MQVTESYLPCPARDAHNFLCSFRTRMDTVKPSKDPSCRISASIYCERFPLPYLGFLAWFSFSDTQNCEAGKHFFQLATEATRHKELTCWPQSWSVRNRTRGPTNIFHTNLIPPLSIFLPLWSQLIPTPKQSQNPPSKYLLHLLHLVLSTPFIYVHAILDFLEMKAGKIQSETRLELKNQFKITSPF